VPVRAVATITTHYGQFAALSEASRGSVRRALHFAAAPIIGKNQSDYLRRESGEILFDR
jgi:hypothetical protein